MAVPAFHQFFRPVLELCDGRVFTAPSLLEPVCDRLGLTQVEREERTESGRSTRADDRIRWALTHLFRAGLLDRQARGAYTLSARGHGLLQAQPGPVPISMLEQFPEYREFRRIGAVSASAGLDPAGVPQVLSPMEVIARARAELDAAVRAEILERMRRLEPGQFEQLIVDLMVHLGFGGGIAARRGERIGRSGDGGVDGVLREGALDLDQVYVQAKRNGPDNAVGPEKIQAFAGSMLARGAAKGVLATTSRFTEAARREAEKLAAQKRIVLLDGEEVAALMIEHGVGVRTVETFRISRADLSD